MNVRKIEMREWREVCDRISIALLGRAAEIEVASPEIGVHVESDRLRLIGIVYDPKDDLIEIVTSGIDHLVHHPRELYVDLDGADVVALTVIDQGGARQFVRLRNPLMLPAPR